jgi:hypothetical protein
MTEVNPCGFLQNAGATHTAEQMRNWHALLVNGKGGATSLLPRGGVNPALGNALQVTQTGSPSMAVIVKSGHATIPGSEGSKQGVYSVLNDGDVTLSIAAAHATLNRIDLVCFKVEDSAYSGGANTSSLVVVSGTPASSPAAPSAPANSITLAQVLIVANDTSITTGEITDTRIYMSALGGLVSIKDSTELATLTAFESMMVYQRDLDKIKVHNGSAWVTLETAGSIIARARRTTTSTTTTTEVGVLRLDDIPIKANRTYHIITSSLQVTSSGATDGLSANMRYTTDGSTPTTSSTILNYSRDGQDNSTTGMSQVVSVSYTPTVDETLSLLLSIQRVSGSGNAQISGSATNPIEILVIDLGPDVTDTGVDI